MYLGTRNYKEKRILITGSNGMLGQALMCALNKHEVIGIDLPIDLRFTNQLDWSVGNIMPDYIIHTAAKVGGVKANSDNQADFYRDNILINTNVLDAALKFKTKKVVSLLSTCVYPDKVTYPLTEDQIHNGPPHSSNYAYAYAKRMLDIQSQAYRDQFGCNFVTVVPNNLLGIKDNFHLENSHVIPAMIRKIYEAKQAGTDVTLWGDGSPLREFTYVDDLAEILLFILDEYNERDPINVGCCTEYSIKQIAEMVAENLGFKGKIIWDISKPAGQFRKPSSNQKLKQLVESKGFELEYTPLQEGLQEVCSWFVINYPNVRGVK